MKRRNAAEHSVWFRHYGRRWYEEFGELPGWYYVNPDEYRIRFRGQLLPDIFGEEELDDVEAMIIKIRALTRSCTIKPLDANLANTSNYQTDILERI